MKVDIHQHVVKDLELLSNEILKIQIKKLLKESFYNVSIPSPKYPRLHCYTTNTNVEILFIKNKHSILVVSIQEK